MIPRVGELGEVLEISEHDLEELGHLRRQRFLEKVLQVALPAASAIAGLVSGDALYPIRQPAPYPYGTVIAAVPVSALSRRRSWIATVIVSFVLFILAFALIAWMNTSANDSLGVTTRYGVFDERQTIGR